MAEGIARAGSHYTASVMDDRLDHPHASLLLASRSPRRRAMLADIGVVVVAEHPGFDDSVLETRGVHRRPDAWVAALAYLKARAGADHARARNVPWALGADTACVLNDDPRPPRVIGTPATPEHARAILDDFIPPRGQTRDHAVITGVALVHAITRARILFTDTALVRMGHVPHRDLDAYVASGEWAGKAGAYNLGDRLAAGWPIDVVGDPGTVTGLPLRRLAALFDRLGIRRTPHGSATA